MQTPFETNITLEDGYEVAFVDVCESQKAINIYVKYTQHSIKCPNCSEKTKIYDRLPKTWRDLNCGDYKVYVMFKNPRSACEKHGIKTTEVTWAKPKHRFTIQFEDFICELAKNNSNLQIAKKLDEHDTRIRRVIHRRENEKIN